MSEFKAIETQEELDNVIKDRLARNTKNVTAEVAKKYEGFLSPKELSEKTAGLESEIENLKKQLGEKDTSIADLTAKNTAFEIAAAKSKIAREYGIPEELAGRLSGSSEEEYKADAERLAKFFKSGRTQPMFDSEGGDTLSGVEKAFYSKNPDLKTSRKER